MTAQDQLDLVNSTYSAVARGTNHDRSYANKVATAFGYGADELLNVPEDSHMGLSCGNPVATANLREGEHILDLGSGGGIDVFLAARQVGDKGQVIGLDGSDDMVTRARNNARRVDLNPPHVAFVKATFGKDRLPLQDGSVDCILSNCVLNLVPVEVKPALLAELYRVLRPGGRLAIHDILAKHDMPPELKDNLAMLVGCVSGAMLNDAFEKMLQDAGFDDIVIVDSKSDMNIYMEAGEPPMSSCCSTANVRFSKPSADFNVNDHVASCSIYALKPGFPPDTPLPDMLTRWYDAFPAPKADPAHLSVDEVVQQLQNGDKNAIAIIDVRDANEVERGTVPGAHHWPSRSFYFDREALAKEVGEVRRVAFFCGSSSGRGPRCAAWYQDYLNEQGITSSQAFIMTGGYKAWVARKEVSRST